jgi:hypothetical protein
MKRYSATRSSLFLSLGLISIIAPAIAETLNTSQCAALQAQYDALVVDMNRDIGCPTNKPSNPPKQLVPVEGEAFDPNNSGCNSASQQAERAAWMAKHPEFKTLQNQMAKSCWAPDICANSQIPAPKLNADLDDDGIPDVQEAALIKRFAPYVRFNKGEDRRPMDFMQFVRQSNLVTPNHFTSGDDQVFLANKYLATTLWMQRCSKAIRVRR